MDIQFIRNSLEETKAAYRSSKNNLLWLEQYHSENQNYRDYEGREILELLQNADDAQSSHVDIHLDSVNHTLSIKNYGEQTLVFTKEGMRSIMSRFICLRSPILLSTAASRQTATLICAGSWVFHSLHTVCWHMDY